MSRLRQRAKAHLKDADLRTFGLEMGPGRLEPPQMPAWHQLIYAIGGALSVESREVSWVVPPHRAVWLPAGTAYELRLASAVSLRTLYIATHIYRRAPRQPANVNVSPLLRELILHAVALGALHRSDPSQKRVIGLILDQLEFVDGVPLQLPLPSDPRARRLTELLMENPAAGKRTLPALARRAGASVRTLERAFADTGMTFDQWRRRLRMRTAIESMAAGASVTSAALDCGYDSVSAFVAAFRRELGTTPAKWSPRLRR